MSEPCRCPACGQVLPDDDDLRIDPAGIVIRRGHYAVLTRQEFTVFEALNAARPRHRSKEQLLADLYWLDQDEPALKIIDVWICKIRKKVKPLGMSIQTLWGRGYRLSVQRGPEP